MDATARAAAAATSRNWGELEGWARNDADATVRATALAALVNHGPRPISSATWITCVRDPDARVRLRAAQVAPALGRAARNDALLTLLADDDAWVAEAAAYAIGEHPAPTAKAKTAVVAAATAHADPLVREAAVAALGAIGDPSTLPAVLHACDDKPAIRRRAVLALAAFDGADVEARLHAALEDRDWQVRQAAEDLLRA